jgi:hypothetical protein
VITLARLIEQFEPDLLLRHGHHLLPSQVQALSAMARCRTRFAPQMLAQCSACGEQRCVPHSCGHRACPHCQQHESQLWLQRQLQSLVPATYFLITFTLPGELRALAWSHQRLVYPMLMQCAWQTLASFSRNDARLAATPGAVGVLHTHSRRLDLHPHVHMVMPAAALDTQRGLWRTKCRRPRRRGQAAAAQAGSGGFLFSHKALAKVFRAKLLAALQAAGLRLPDSLPATWVVDCRCVGDGQKALLYLGRYLYRGVVQEADILSCCGGKVTFRYRDARSGKAALRTLPGADFLWLVLQHVLPKGLRRVRSFGFLHPNSRRALRLLQLLHLRPARPPAQAAPVPRPVWRCGCGGAMSVLRRRMPPEATKSQSSSANSAAPHDKPDKAHPMEGFTTH